MSSDSEKIVRLETLLKQSQPEIVSNREEIISLTLAINDSEERDQALLDATKALASAEQVGTAMRAAKAIAADFEKATALYEISARLASTNQRDEALSVLHEAEKVVDGVNEPWQKAELLSQIAQLLTEQGVQERARLVWDQAISVARIGENSSDIQRSVDSSSVLREISERLALLGEEEKAREVAQSIKSSGKRVGALQAIDRIKQSRAH